MTDIDATNLAADDDAHLSSAEGVADQDNALTGDQTDDAGEDLDPEDPDNQGEAADDGEEIELEGKRYRVPKELKDGYLRQADYTRKTQETADQRRDVEAKAQAVARDAAMVTELREDYGKVHALKAQVDYYGRVDWAAYSAQDPSSAQQAWMVYQQAKDALNDAQKGVDSKEAELRASRERETANARATTLQELRKTIPEFGPQKAQALADFARDEFGVRPEELANVDARTWQMLNRLHQAESKAKALETKQTAAQRQAKVEAVKPAASVRGSSPADNRPRDSDSHAVWLKKRNAQLAKRG